MQPFLQSLQQRAIIVTNDPRFAGLFPTPAPARRSDASAAAAASPAPSSTK